MYLLLLHLPFHTPCWLVVSNFYARLLVSFVKATTTMPNSARLIELPFNVIMLSPALCVDLELDICTRRTVLQRRGMIDKRSVDVCI
jgi:hypothetical protein